MESLELLIDGQPTGALLPLGTVAARSSEDRRLRVRSRSAARTAQNVVVSVIGDDGEQLLLSPDGVNFTATHIVGDVAPSATSAEFWLRRVTPSTTPTGPCSAALVVEPTHWS